MEIDGQKLTHCPMRLFLDNPDDMGELVWYYAAYKRGQLPNEGGLLDQPAKMMQAFRVIDNANATLDRQRRLEQEAEAKRGRKNRGR